jgi:hypothetical protein
MPGPTQTKCRRTLQTPPVCRYRVVTKATRILLVFVTVMTQRLQAGDRGRVADQSGVLRLEGIPTTKLCSRSGAEQVRPPPFPSRLPGPRSARSNLARTPL